MASNTLTKVTNPALLDSPSYLGSPSAYSQPATVTNEGIPWRYILRIFRKYWKLSLAFALVLEIAIALLVFSLANTYESSATIEVEPPATGTSTANGLLAPAPVDQNYLQTQIELLQGDNLALDVIQELHLSENPIFLKQSWIQKLPAQVMAWIKPANSDGRPLTENLLRTFHGSFGVTEVKDSGLVQVQYESYDPQLSAQVVSAAVRQYMDLTHRSKYESTLHAAQSLAPELNDLKGAAERSQQALLQFQRTHDGVELESPATNGSDDSATATTMNSPVSVRVAQLNQQLTQAIADRMQQESYFAMLSQGSNEALPQAKDDPVIQGLTTRVADVRGQLAEALSIYGGNNPEVRKLQQQAEELDSQLQAARDRIANQLQASYNSARQREQLIRKELSDLKGPLDRANANIVQYDALKRDADATSNLYTTLSSEIKQMAVSGSLNATNIRVVDEARIPETPSGPHRVRILMFGLAFGLFGGGVLAFIAESLDDTVSSLDDLRGWSSLPPLALVPRISGRNDNHRGLFSTQKLSPSLPPALAVAPKGVRIFCENANSPEKESIRNLETSIRLSLLPDQRRIKTVLITSAFPREGKTTVAANLAVALARHGRTCLVDADLRRPAITMSFGLSHRPGLQDLLVSTQNLAAICAPLAESSNLVVLGAGAKRPDALEMLTSQRMHKLLDELQERFEFIVIDSAPIIPFSDARWLSTLSDSSILVARSSETTRKAVMWSMELLQESHPPFFGIVLNDVNLESEYYSYGADRYSYR
jgi:polysaccharide biosynthesis transport protein